MVRFMKDGVDISWLSHMNSWPIQILKKVGQTAIQRHQQKQQQEDNGDNNFDQYHDKEYQSIINMENDEGSVYGSYFGVTVFFAFFFFGLLMYFLFSYQISSPRDVLFFKRGLGDRVREFAGVRTNEENENENNVVFDTNTNIDENGEYYGVSPVVNKPEFIGIDDTKRKLRQKFRKEGFKNYEKTLTGSKNRKNNTKYNSLPDDYSAKHRRFNKKSKKEDYNLTMALPYNHLKIIPNAGGGDCFFHCYTRILDNIGIHATINQLRRVVADSMTEEKFVFMSEVFQNAVKERDRGLVADYMFMHNVKSLEGMKEALMSRRYFGDEMALQSLENQFDVRCLTLQLKQGSQIEMSRRYSHDEKKKKWYSMVLLDQDMTHYELIEYKGKAALRENELPAKIQRLLIQQEVEHRERKQLEEKNE